MQHRVEAVPEGQTRGPTLATPPAEKPVSGRILAWILILAVLWFGPLGYRKLIKPDEGRYAEIAREMAVTGDWVTPRLNGIKYFEKPPLQYWATAAAYKALGQSEWTARLWPALTGFLGILLAGFTAARLFGSRSGMLAAIVLSSAFLYVGMGHINTLDMGVSFFLQLAVSGFLLGQHSGRRSRQETGWMLLAWAAAALALLSKGLIGLLFPAATLVLYSLIRRELTPWRRLHPIKGLALFLLIAAPWFVAVSHANPEFAHFFFVHEHVERFLTTQHRRIEPWWFFGPILLLGLVPWTTLALGALFKKGRSTQADASVPRHGFSTRTFLILWCAVIFTFFSASGSKLPSYILPMFPALAMLAGDVLSQADASRLRRHLWPSMALFMASALGLLAYLLSKGSASLHEDARQYGFLLASTLGLMALGTGVSVSVARKSMTAGIMALGLTGLLVTQAAMLGHNTLHRSMSAWSAAVSVRPQLNPGVPFYSVRTYDQTLNFYLGRTVTLVDFEDEMAFGLKQEPHLAIPSLDGFIPRWRADADAFALMSPDTYDALRAKGLPMTVVVEDPGRIIVRKPTH